MFIYEQVRSWGGVARNCAETMARCGIKRPVFITVVGLDSQGNSLRSECENLGLV